MYFSTSNRKINFLDVFFSTVFLFGLYSGFSFFITENLFIPYIVCGISSIYFLIINFNDLKFSNIVPIIFLAIITFLGIIFSDQMSEFFVERMKGLIQLVYSILISLLFYLNLKKWPPKNICKLFFIFLLLILIGSYLEIFTDLKEISDDFRDYMFKVNLYDADLRDIYFYGIIRPKLFTEEPSHVAKFYTLSLFVWFSLSENRWRYLHLSFFLFLGLFLIRSPIVFIIIPISFFIEIFLRKKIRIKSVLKQKGVIIEKSFAVLIVIVTILGVFSVNTILEKRIDEIISGNDDSFGVRFTGPGLIAVEVLKKFPIWGAGITGKEAIIEIIEEVYYKINVNYYSIQSFSTNIVMSFFIYYGFFGGILFAMGIYSLLKRLNINQKFFIFITFIIFGQTMGSFVGLRPWCYFFVIASVTHFYPLYKNNPRPKVMA